MNHCASLWIMSCRTSRTDPRLSSVALGQKKSINWLLAVLTSCFLSFSRTGHCPISAQGVYAGLSPEVAESPDVFQVSPLSLC